MDASRIEAEYQRRRAAYPHARWGWSFMYVPEHRLSTAKFALVGLNPGGSQIDPPGQWDVPDGNAYLDQSWRGLPPGQHHLQLEVRALLAAANAGPEDVFAANLTPFRSPSWDALPDKPGALAFSGDLWRWVLSQSPARTIFSIGKRPGEHLAGLLGAHLHNSVPAQWGSQTIDTYRAASGHTVVALPHLSRFKVFGGGRTAAQDVISGLAS